MRLRFSSRSAGRSLHEEGQGRNAMKKEPIGDFHLWVLKTVMTLWEKEIFFFKEQNYAFVQSMIGEP